MFLIQGKPDALCVASGKHVICEKPLAVALAVRDAATTGTRTLVNYGGF